MADDGLVTTASAHDFPTTLARLTAAIEAKGAAIMARIDHAAGAVAAGLNLRPTTVLIFGNPKSGTPLMQRAQRAGIDLPLRALVWQEADGIVRVTYCDPAWIAARHAVDAGEVPAVGALAATLREIATRATAP